MTRLIAAIDNSTAARPVCRMALAAAPVFGAEVECVHVLENGDDTARAAAASVGLPFLARTGDPFERLTAVVEEPDVAGVVVGTHGGSAFRGRVGHLPMALAGATDRPVIAVPPTALPPDRITRVVVAVKGTPARRIDLKRTIELARASDLEIVAVHVDDETTIPAFSDQVQHETEAYTTEFFARNLLGAVEVRLELRIGSPVEEILDVARVVEPDVLAIGWPHHGNDPARGDVAREILERSDIPVMLVSTT